MPDVKRLASQTSQRYNTSTPNMKKSPSEQAAAADAAPDQEAFLTPYLTTVSTGTLGNSGIKNAKE